ncbi:VCBS repeat-containing protein [Adhaeribacter swui]|uniref:VCBS repeat-containing protein n=1 Tax=Adhaeribacter swui TaxID=2086471 RepID=A0A7G7G2S7_9BACT|nr:FG-GAP-like repeat-containing protein [Adhaeribacter swui]QNF31461.1 VCBS repeat-containing protein [Adhaeribacter swui]
MPRIFLFLLLLFIGSLWSCQNKERAAHQEMLLILQKTAKQYNHHQNKFASEAILAYYDSLYQQANSAQDKVMLSAARAHALLMLGKEQEAVDLLHDAQQKLEAMGLGNKAFSILGPKLALAYLRLGERSNCVMHHSSETCIFPIRGTGIHTQQVGSQKAIELYRQLVAAYPANLTYRWLLNLSYMTLGEYQQVKNVSYYLPDLDVDTSTLVKPFRDIAKNLKLDINNMAGGSIAEDFDNDGYIDLVTSGWGLADEMHYFKNNGDGTFSDLSERSGLKSLVGGLNMMQTDYNNDGYKDIFVTRGGWVEDQFGRQPNSLIKNNGDGTFTDVTTISGLLSFYPTQTATWNDFNNDGWLDVFIGNESRPGNSKFINPCEMYLNNQDGTFTNITKEANLDLVAFVKGVTSGDYDNDGRQDIFISTMNGDRYLFKNTLTKGKTPIFKNVTASANLDKDKGHTFPTWFWDFDNDGWLDILVCDYNFESALSHYAAAEALKKPIKNAGMVYLYKNNRNGTFTNISEQVGLNRVAFAMGSNFGDIDNDGFLDMYLATGNPDYESLVPNKMFKNLGGQKFADVTTAARVGHLQKGHGVSFADMDNDGDQDIYVDMGGAYIGDAYQNSFFLNPGQNNNRWIYLELVGAKANRSAIGSRIKVTFRENGIARSVYRDVNSGGSFGASPLRREIGIGQADLIDEIVIQWAGTNQKQVFRNIQPNQLLRIKEGETKPEMVPLNKLSFEQPKLPSLTQLK